MRTVSVRPRPSDRRFSRRSPGRPPRITGSRTWRPTRAPGCRSAGVWPPLSPPNPLSSASRAGSWSDPAPPGNRTRSASSVMMKVTYDILDRCARSIDQLWRAIAARATLPLAGRVLLEVLHRDDPYLVRYHAAKVLL